jgi:hypothetical protein
MLTLALVVTSSFIAVSVNIKVPPITGFGLLIPLDPIRVTAPIPLSIVTDVAPVTFHESVEVSPVNELINGGKAGAKAAPCNRFKSRLIL